MRVALCSPSAPPTPKEKSDLNFTLGIKHTPNKRNHRHKAVLNIHNHDCRVKTWWVKLKFKENDTSRSSWLTYKWFCRGGPACSQWCPPFAESCQMPHVSHGATYEPVKKLCIQMHDTVSIAEPLIQHTAIKHKSCINRQTRTCLLIPHSNKTQVLHKQYRPEHIWSLSLIHI